MSLRAFVSAACLLFASCSAFALDPVAAGLRGELTLTTTWNAQIVAPGEFADFTAIKRRTTVTCPLVSSDPLTVSLLDGPTAAQAAALEQVGEAARAQVEAVPAEAVGQMQDLDQQMRSCRSKGGSEQACGMQIMQAMQANPQLLEQMGRMGADDSGDMARAEANARAVDGHFQAWYNEGCRGQMQVDDSSQADDPTLPGPEPVIRTTGTRPIDTRDTLVTVETDLNTGLTRYQILSPDAEGFLRDAEGGTPAARVRAMAMPVGHVLAGPFRGPISSGSHEYPTEGGKVSIAWEFRRLQ